MNNQPTSPNDPETGARKVGTYDLPDAEVTNVPKTGTGAGAPAGSAAGAGAPANASAGAPAGSAAAPSTISTPTTTTAPRRSSLADEPTPAPPARRSMSWLWWLIGLIVLLALLWWAWNALRPNSGGTPTPAATPAASGVLPAYQAAAGNVRWVA